MTTIKLQQWPIPLTTTRGTILDAALAAGVQRWLLRRLSFVEQWVMIVCGLALIYPAPAADAVGLVGIAAVLAWQWLGRKTVARAGS